MSAEPDNQTTTPWRLPEGWRENALAELGTIVSGGTPSRNQPSYWNGDIPWASVKDFTDESCFLGDTEEHISQAGLAASAATLVPENTPVLCTRMAVGRCALTTRPTAINQDLRAILLSAEVDKHFFIRLLHHHGIELDRLSVGSTVRGITLPDIRCLSLAMPEDACEQERIAVLLDMVDAATAKTEAVIAKLKCVRAGLLHDLLTRGVDSDGQLRPSYDQAPQLYKDSPLGPVPREWEVACIDECCSHVVDCPHSTPNYLTNGVLVARTMHIRDGEYDTGASSRVTEAEYSERIARLVPGPGDVIFTREAPVGEAFTIPDGMRICLGQRVMLLRPVEGRLLGKYLVAQIYSGEVRRRIDALTGGTTNPHLNVAEVRGFAIPLPPWSEQQRVVARLSQQRELMIAEGGALAKLQSLKSGLASDLLTGRVRVPVGVAS